MIIVKNRELLIPNNERYIGTTYDTETENRVFQVPRFSQRGVDLAALTFRLDIQYANNSYDTVILDKEVDDEFVLLIWRITSATLQVPGTMYIGLRAIDGEATVKWSSFSAAMYVERHLNTPGNYSGSLTEIEQMEQDHQYMKGVVNELKEHIDYTFESEAWAVGKRDGEDVPATDPTYHNNSKYYKEVSDSHRKTAERYANGKENGTDVTSGDGYHDNSKYYKELADDHRKTAEAYAKGTVNGTAVTSGQTGYQDNAKYYKEQVQSRLNQIDTNTSNIAVQTARIDNIASLPSGSTSGDAELMDIRVGADGVTYTSAGAAVRANDSLLKSQLEAGCGGEFIQLVSGWYDLSGSSVSSLTPASSNSYKCGHVACVEGNLLVASLTGGVSARAFAFLDSNLNVILKAGESKAYTDTVFVAPQNAAWFVVNNQLSRADGYLQKGLTADYRLREMGLIDHDCSRHLPLDCITHGDFDTTTGTPRYNCMYRVCSIKPMSYDRAITVVPDSGWRIYISLVNDGVLAQGGWKTLPYTIAPGQRFCFTIARSVENTAENANIAEFISHIAINSAFDWVDRYLSPIFPGLYGLPNINTADKTLTIPAYCTVYWKNDFYTILDDTTVSYAGGQSAARKIVFDPVTKALSAVDYNVFTPDVPVIALIQSGGSNYKANQVAISCPYTVNGIRYGNNSALVSIFPCINGIPNIDTTNKTLTIKAPTSMFWEGGHYLLTTNTVIDLTEYSGGDAKKVVFDTNTKAFHTVGYNVIDAARVPIALIQFNGSAFVGAAISCDYSVNGIRYGIDQSGYRQYNVESIGHRGYNTVAPENTLPAFRLSKIHNFDWIETDVQFTSDDVPVILHDQSINRTARNADGTKLSSTVNINDITYEQALEYDFGIWKGAEYAGTKIPSFDQCIALCRNIGLKARIELKSETVTTSKLSTLVDIVRKYGMLKNVEWISSSLTLLRHIATTYPSFNLAYIVGTISPTVITNTLDLRTSENNVRLSAELSGLTDELVALVSAEDIPLDVWTVNTNTQVLNAPVYASTFTSNLPHAGEVLYNANIA